MKNDELLAILSDDSLTNEEKGAKIQKLNGLDRNADSEKHSKEIESLKASFEEERKTWNDEKAKYDGYVTKEDHQKVVDELSAFQKEKTLSRQNAYLKSLGVLEGYEEFLGSKINWENLTYDESNGTYAGEGLDDCVKSLKEKFPAMYGNVGQPTPTPSVKSKGAFPSETTSIDLTKL